MSIDLLQCAEVYRLTCVHDVEGQQREPTRDFRGWYVFAAGAVRTVGWTVQPYATCNNPWHAEVNIAGDDEQSDEFLQRCQKMALSAQWRPRPLLEADEEFLEQAADSLL